jgi:MoaA/NifB/PqqE/SkfB family radical SAM enzyme
MKKALVDRVVEGLRAGVPSTGPLTVHVDITNACNAACITCWDHSPLLEAPRSQAWKRQRLPLATFLELVEDLEALGSVQSLILSGMGEPLLHPDVGAMIAAVKARGWHLTILTNLLAADIEALAGSGVDQLLIGVHGATPESYVAFHPGWTEAHFFTMCRHLRTLQAAGVRTRHVQVIDRDNQHELEAMVRMGRTFGAERVNFKLASLAAGTERIGITEAQRDRLRAEDVPAARALAERLGVHTNLELFAEQLEAAAGLITATTPMETIGCHMGHVYTRVTVELDVLYCCNTAVKVGNLAEAPLRALWRGEAWQALRARLARGEWFPGCERCGKFEQNRKWARRLAERRPEGETPPALPSPAERAARLRVLA